MVLRCSPWESRTPLNTFDGSLYVLQAPLAPIVGARVLKDVANSLYLSKLVRIMLGYLREDEN